MVVYGDNPSTKFVALSQIPVVTACADRSWLASPHCIKSTYISGFVDAKEFVLNSPRPPAPSSFSAAISGKVKVTDSSGANT